MLQVLQRDIGHSAWPELRLGHGALTSAKLHLPKVNSLDASSKGPLSWQQPRILPCDHTRGAMAIDQAHGQQLSTKQARSARVLLLDIVSLLSLSPGCLRHSEQDLCISFQRSEAVLVARTWPKHDHCQIRDMLPLVVLRIMVAVFPITVISIAVKRGYESLPNLSRKRSMLMCTKIDKFVHSRTIDDRHARDR